MSRRNSDRESITARITEQVARYIRNLNSLSTLLGLENDDELLQSPEQKRSNTPRSSLAELGGTRPLANPIIELEHPEALEEPGVASAASQMQHEESPSPPIGIPESSDSDSPMNSLSVTSSPASSQESLLYSLLLADCRRPAQPFRFAEDVAVLRGLEDESLGKERTAGIYLHTGVQVYARERDELKRENHDLKLQEDKLRRELRSLNVVVDSNEGLRAENKWLWDRLVVLKKRLGC